MADMMMFPDTVEEFMKQHKITDTEEIYTNGAELVPIFRMKQWFDHMESEWETGYTLPDGAYWKCKRSAYEEVKRMYESPIEIMWKDVEEHLETMLKDNVYKVIKAYGIKVDEAELLKALQYDRQQYEKGYEDAKAERGWILCSERIPDEGRECWITTKSTDNVYRGTFTEFYSPRHDIGFICDDGFMWWNTAKAWMYCEKPEPYRGEKNDSD